MEPALNDIEHIRQLNSRVGWMISDFICNTPRAITCSLMEEMVPDLVSCCREDEELSYRSLLGAFCGIDPDNSDDERLIYDTYLAEGVKRLAPEPFLSNPYYQGISIPEVSSGEWSLTYQEYAPYEAFISDDLLLKGDMEIPCVGYFREKFRYPSVMQAGREWMSIKPSEIVTSQDAVDKAHGKVVTFGLGLGYFVYMALAKSEVESVTVVELDPSVISLFKEYILPQFPRRYDVRIVQSDAFEFMRNMRRGEFDFAFVDIWHDISDGVQHYVRAREFERLHPQMQFTYWLERSIRCALASSL
ncbi:MAG: hypothetical protein KBT00_06140, partial [Bacteroidales bacterium]|nr:hypothetical protein [Candidatus Cacconaster merdequi]